MKKLVIFLGFALGFHGLSYGMDVTIGDDQTLDSFKEAIESKNWVQVWSHLQGRPADDQSYIDFKAVLMQQTRECLNTLIGSKEGLFQILGRNAFLSADKELARELLKKLIPHGLDFTPQKNDHYYPKYKNSFIKLLEEVIQANPDQEQQLRQKLALINPIDLLPSEPVDPITNIDLGAIVGNNFSANSLQAISNPGPTTPPAVNTSRVPTGTTFAKRIPLAYVSIGAVSAVVILSCLLWAKYKADDKQEDDEEQQEIDAADSYQSIAVF
jgi:hypothetical protein